jgi:hypothetical protein
LAFLLAGCAAAVSAAAGLAVTMRWSSSDEKSSTASSCLTLR